MFTDEELSEILRILAIVLHLGNIQYVGKYSSEVLEKVLDTSSIEIFRELSSVGYEEMGLADVNEMKSQRLS
jgi:myosin heavy subunit